MRGSRNNACESTSYSSVTVALASTHPTRIMPAKEAEFLVLHIFTFCLFIIVLFFT